MALLHADSFDHLDLNRYLAFENHTGGTNPLSSGSGRRGTSAVQVGDTGVARSLGVRSAISGFSGTAVILACAINLTDTTGRVLYLQGPGGNIITIEAAGASGWTLEHDNADRITGGDPIAAGNWYFVEAKFDTSGNSELRVNGISVGTHSGSVGVSPSTVSQISLGMDSGGLNISGFGNFIDDVVVFDDSGISNNDFPGDVQVQYLLPDSDGNVVELLGSDGDSIDNYDNVNESTPSSAFPGADYNGSTGTGNMDLYRLAGLSTDRTWTVHGVQVASIVGQGVGANAFGRLLAQDASSTQHNAIVGLSTSGAYQFMRLSATPSGTTWTSTDFDDLQVGFQVTGATGV